MQSGSTLPPVHPGSPISSVTLAPSSANLSHLAPSPPIERNPSPGDSLPPPTPVRLARDLDRAGFFAGDSGGPQECQQHQEASLGTPDASGSHHGNGVGHLEEAGTAGEGARIHDSLLAAPEQAHQLDDTSSEWTDFSISTADGVTEARTAEMVWFERVQRMDRRERERGREAVEAREERIREEAERLASERGMALDPRTSRFPDLDSDSVAPGTAALEGPSTPSRVAFADTSRAGTPRSSPKRRTRVLEMVDSFESLRKEAGSIAGSTPASPRFASARSPTKR